MTFALLMRRLAFVGGFVLLAGCAHQRPLQLYMWETFPRQQYEALLSESASPEDQIRTLEAQAEKAHGANAALPPGFRAHLGMLYLNVGNVDQARASWLAEKSAFPESSPYMDRLLNRLQTPTGVAKSENPA